MNDYTKFDIFSLIDHFFINICYKKDKKNANYFPCVTKQAFQNERNVLIEQTFLKNVD